MEKALNFVFITYVYGSLVSYILVTKKLALLLLDEYLKQLGIDVESNIFITLGFYFFLSLLAVPFSLQNTVDGIKKITKFSFVIILYIGILLVAQTPAYKQEYQPTYVPLQPNFVTRFL